MQFFDDGVVVFYSPTPEKFDDSVADSNWTMSRCFIRRRQILLITNASETKKNDQYLTLRVHVGCNAEFSCLVLYRF